MPRQASTLPKIHVDHRAAHPGCFEAAGADSAARGSCSPCPFACELRSDHRADSGL